MLLCFKYLRQKIDAIPKLPVEFSKKIGFQNCQSECILMKASLLSIAALAQILDLSLPSVSSCYLSDGDQIAC